MLKAHRYDVFYADLSTLGIDNHYVVCVSNWKANLKSKSISVCILTSKDKNHNLPTHVDYELFNKKTIIKCENIYTLEKENLIRKVDNIDSIFKQLEIDNALRVQLQLTNHYINNSLEDLEINFMRKVEYMGDLNKIVLNRKEISELCKNNENLRCIDKCKEQLEEIKTLNIDNQNEYYWHCYYHLSLTYYKLKDYTEALNNAHMSLRNIGDISSANNRYAFSMWLLSSIYECIGDINKTINIQDSLIKYYKETSCINLRISCIFNKMRLLNKIDKMLSLIKIVERIQQVDRNSTNLTKENLLKEMYKDYNRAISSF